MANLSRYTRFLEELDTVWVGSHFTEDQSDTFWVDTITDTGTAAVGDAVNGVMVLTPSDGTVADNDECYLGTANELFKFGTNREIYGLGYVQFSEANTDDANVFVGFMNAMNAANSLVDDGGGPKVSGSTLAIAKVDGGTKWVCYSSCNGTSTSTTSTTTAGGSAYQKLEIFCKDWDGTSMEVTFKVDGQYLKDSNGYVIRHTVAIASATEMNFGAGVKNGGANLETLNIDYLYASQTRV